MNKKQLSPKAAVHLTRWTAEKFDEMVEESRAVLGHHNQQDGIDFIINTLIYLSDTVYSQEETKDKPSKSDDVIDSLMFGLNLNPIKLNQSIIDDFDKQMDIIAKMMKNYKPPKAGEF